MTRKEFEKKLEKVKKESKKNIRENKEELTKILNNAEYSVILQTDKSGAFIGNKFDITESLCNLFSNLLEQGFTKKELIDFLNMVDKKTEEHRNSTKEALEKISNLLDKAIKLEELKSKKED